MLDTKNAREQASETRKSLKIIKDTVAEGRYMCTYEPPELVELGYNVIM